MDFLEDLFEDLFECEILFNFLINGRHRRVLFFFVFRSHLDPFEHRGGHFRCLNVFFIIYYILYIKKKTLIDKNSSTYMAF